MNLPNDVSRCAGILDDHGNPFRPFDLCQHRNKCERYLQLARDRENGITHYRGMSVITNCLVDGEYTLLIPTKETQC